MFAKTKFYMKKIFSFIVVFSIAAFSFAQQEYIPPTYNNRPANQPEENGFKKQNLFIGGSLALGVGNGTFNIGVTPEIGYSLNKWFDAGVAVNLNYYTQNYDYGSYADKFKSFNYGAGIFARAWVLPFLYLQAQPELNWINQTQTGYPSATFQSSSLLVGVGYGSRLIGSHYTYFTLMIDVLGDKNSPYVDGYGNAYPIIRAGFGLYLHPNRR